VYSVHRRFSRCAEEEYTLKAITYHRYGPPDVLEFQEVDEPVVNDDEVLVRVRAASANPRDWHFMRGLPYVIRPQFGLRAPKNHSLGSDLAGQVEAVGRNVTRFHPGDEVFADVLTGAFAEYASVPEGFLARKPANLTFEQAAAVPLAALTALQGLRDHGRVQPGQKVLIVGAAGGVGTFAVQLAKWLGADVTGVCSTRNVDMVRSIGADHVVDYTQEDFALGGQKYDLVIQLAGTRSPLDCRRALTPKGTLLLSAENHAVAGSGPSPGSSTRCWCHRS
jgi:NADPH:quinone reductase-like Zn-dependent oxidoreductase